VRSHHRSLVPLFALLSALLVGGCRGQVGPPDPEAAAAAAAKANPEANQKLQVGITQAINEASSVYHPLEYDYDEDLLVIVDGIEAYVAGKASVPPPRSLPKASQEEELDHFRETIRRWKAETGRDLRAEIDSLKADVASRDKTKAFHPEFHKKFSTTFDEFIKIEVEEMRERRNRAIHRAAKPLLDQYRASAPESVRQYEQSLNAPGYALPADEPAAKGGGRPSAAKDAAGP